MKTLNIKSIASAFAALAVTLVLSYSFTSPLESKLAQHDYSSAAALTASIL
jgi:flagellar motor component MotA